MVYKINGTEITIQPTTARWLQRYNLGRTGAGNAIYAQIREFEMRWQLVDQAQVKQLVTFFNSINYTGTVVVDLPEWGSLVSGAYVFKSYSGCVIDEPEFNVYFAEHSTDTILLISNIVT